MGRATEPLRAPGGLILAGGQGRRMGGADKALLPFRGQTLLAQVLERFSPQVDELALSANGDAVRFAAWGLPVLADKGPSRGPLSGLAAGLAWAAGRGLATLVTAPVDAPFLPQDLVPRLLAVFRGAPVAAGLGAVEAIFPDPREFANLNTPDDLAQAEA